MYRSVTVPTIYLIRAEYDASRSRKFSHLPPVLLEWMVPDFSILEFSALEFSDGETSVVRFCFMYHPTNPNCTSVTKCISMAFARYIPKSCDKRHRIGATSVPTQHATYQPKMFRSHLVLNQLMTSFYVFLKLTRDYRERKAEERRFKIEKQPG